MPLTENFTKITGMGGVGSSQTWLLMMSEMNSCKHSPTRCKAPFKDTLQLNADIRATYQNINTSAITI